MKILLFEYLHADSLMFGTSTPSMRAEGRAMLLSLCEDLAALSDVKLSVACCSDAAETLPTPENVAVLQTSVSGTENVSRELCTLANGNGSDLIVLIAPECDNILADVVKTLREDGHEVFSPSCDAIEVCSDKWRTYEMLRDAGIPTISTALGNTPSAKCDADRVVKPRGGAGCEDVVRMCPADFADWKLKETQPLDSFLVQPFISGNSFSVGLIGTKDAASPIVLPLACQDIRWHDNRPGYRGGEILRNSASDRDRLNSLGGQIAKAIELNSGYVGVDLLRPEGSDQFLVTEINPRFSTSYVGYRMATQSNIAEWLLRPNRSDAIIWDNLPLPFAIQSDGEDIKSSTSSTGSG